VLVTLDVHDHPGDFRIGPAHIAALQSAPADLNKAEVSGAVFELYDKIVTILADPLYAPHVRDFTLSFGNHVNDYLCTDAEAWTEYEKLFRALQRRAASAPRPAAPLRLGVSTSFFGRRCEGAW